MWLVVLHTAVVAEEAISDRGKTALGVSLDVGATFGVGALWCPFKRVSLAIRQGVTLQFGSRLGPTSLPDESKHEYESTRHFEGENRIRLYANTAALYALVHF